MRTSLIFFTSVLFVCFLCTFPSTIFSSENGLRGSATFVYGNREPTVPGLKKAWGFTALIQYDSKNILFNTAGIEDILENNFKVMGITPETLDAVVISHHHWEMIQGLGFIMKANPDLPVYTTQSVSDILLKSNPEWKTNFHVVDKVMEFTPNILFQNMKSGRRRGGPRGIYEVHITLKTDKGLVLFTGCGHPQINLIVHKSRAVTREDRVHLIAGGTRLLRPNTQVRIDDSGENFSLVQMNYYSDEYYETLMKDLKEMGVEYVMPTHCTLEPAETVFKNSFGSKYIRQTLGMTLEFPVKE